ncbi:hypothetical protein EXS62_00510 [Candidatus Kaiserbacteria bacterium]|nr:hypothetical protein [Candidatus Kaiserbacteria bacterium]
MDADLEELKRQIERLEKTTTETNRSVHKMRRSQRRQTILRVLWWVVIFGISAYTYLTYVQPYVDQMMSAYGNAKDFQVQVQDFFAQFGHKTAN